MSTMCWCLLSRVAQQSEDPYGVISERLRRALGERVTDQVVRWLCVSFFVFHKKPTEGYVSLVFTVFALPLAADAVFVGGGQTRYSSHGITHSF